jgi:hypothetical protein
VSSTFTQSRDQGPVSHILLGAFVGRAFPTVATIAAYFDDSHSEGILTVAGYLSSVEDWDAAFVPAWRTMLGDSCWPTTPVPEFKSSDCRHGRGSFLGWPRDERRQLTTRAVDIINTAIQRDAMVGFAMLVEMPPDWDKNFKSQFVHFAYTICFGMVVRMALRLTEGVVEDGSTMQFIFDEQRGIEGRSIEMFKEARRIFVPSQSLVDIPLPIFVDSAKVLPIQAADLLAHETYKEYKNRRENRDPSTALTRLLDGRLHYAAYVDAAVTADMVARRERGEMLTADMFSGFSPRLFESGKPLRGK